MAVTEGSLLAPAMHEAPERTWLLAPFLAVAYAESHEHIVCSFMQLPGLSHHALGLAGVCSCSLAIRVSSRSMSVALPDESSQCMSMRLASPLVSSA